MKILIKFISIFLALTMILLPVLGDSGERSYGSGAETSKDGSVRSGNPDSSGNYSNSDSRITDSSRRESKSDESDSREKARKMYDEGSKMREAEGMSGMGFFRREDDSYGSYVTFKIDNSSGEVLNYSIRGVPIFNSIEISGFDFKSSRTEGSETKILDRDGSNIIQIHDNPAAVLKIHTKDKSTLVFNLSQGVNASKVDSIIEISGGKTTDFIVSEKADSINIEGRQIIINASEGNTIFRASPVNMEHDEMENRFMEEVRKKRAGAEVSIGESDNYSIVNYSDDTNVSMDSIEPKRMKMKVGSSDKAGKFILMNIDNSSLAWKEGEKITLYLDNEKMKQVMTEQDLYNATESSFWLNTEGKDKLEALMFIRNFSTRQVDIVVESAVNQTYTPNATMTTTGATPGMTTSTPAPKTPGFGLIAGALAALAALYAVRRRI